MLILSISLSGCSSFSKEQRQQAAARHQIRKAQKERAKQFAKTTKEANRPLHDPVTVSQPTQTMTLEPMGSQNAAPTNNVAAPNDNILNPVAVETPAAQPTP